MASTKNNCFNIIICLFLFNFLMFYWMSSKNKIHSEKSKSIVDNKAPTIEINEFLDICTKGKYLCLGSKRQLSSTCITDDMSNKEPLDKLLHSQEQITKYWSEQIMVGDSRLVKVDGWLEDGDAAIINQILSLQLEWGVYGNIAEIGVHHGKLFIWLMLHLRVHEMAVALDLFEYKQNENIDHSGKGNQKQLKSNIEKYTQNINNVKFIEYNSLNIPLCFFHEQKLQNIRFFSVDGGHYVDHAYEDSWTASSVLVGGGVIAIDDFFHVRGVYEGGMRFLYSNSKMRAFFVGYNKLYLCHEKYYDRYYNAMKSWLVKSLYASNPQYEKIYNIKLAGHKQLLIPPIKSYTLYGYFLPAAMNDKVDITSCDQLHKSSNPDEMYEEFSGKPVNFDLMLPVTVAN